jgi:hypothetical protein
MERVPAPKHRMIREKMEDLMPPGLIYLDTYLAGEATI